MRAIPWILLALLLSACERAQTPATAPQPARRPHPPPTPPRRRSCASCRSATPSLRATRTTTLTGDLSGRAFEPRATTSISSGVSASTTVNHRGPPPNDDFDHDHEGHWGWRVDEILGDIHRWAEEYQPDVVLVHLGSNDVFQRQSLDSTLDELGELIDAVREAQCYLSRCSAIHHP